MGNKRRVFTGGKVGHSEKKARRRVVRVRRGVITGHRKGEKLFSKISILIFFFFKRKFDQSDCRIFHAIAWSAVFWGKFLTLKILAFWLVNFDHVTYILQSNWLNLLPQCKHSKSSDFFVLVVYCWSSIVILISWPILQSDWLNLLLSMKTKKILELRSLRNYLLICCSRDLYPAILLVKFISLEVDKTIWIGVLFTFHLACHVIYILQSHWLNSLSRCK